MHNVRKFFIQTRGLVVVELIEDFFGTVPLITVHMESAIFKE